MRNEANRNIQSSTGGVDIRSYSCPFQLTGRACQAPCGATESTLRATRSSEVIFLESGPAAAGVPASLSCVIQDTDCPSDLYIPTSTPYSIGVNISLCSLSPFRNSYKKKKRAASSSSILSPTFTSACAMNATIDVAGSSSEFAFPNYSLGNGSMHMKGSESLTCADAAPSE